MRFAAELLSRRCYACPTYCRLILGSRWWGSEVAVIGRSLTLVIFISKSSVSYMNIRRGNFVLVYYALALSSSSSPSDYSRIFARKCSASTESSRDRDPVSILDHRKDQITKTNHHTHRLLQWACLGRQLEKCKFKVGLLFCLLSEYHAPSFFEILYHRDTMVANYNRIRRKKITIPDTLPLKLIVG
jgi:hypothetical protein